MDTNIKNDYKLIFNPGVARNLLHMGFAIYDIKPDKNDNKKTVFVFARTQEFENAFAQVNESIKNTNKEAAQ